MGDIEIKSREGFRKAIATLSQLQGEIPGKLDDAESVASAVSTAGKSDDTTAPVFTQVLAALGEAVSGVGTHVGAANQSMSTAVTDLQNLLDGLSEIDDTGAEEVKDA